MVEGTRRSETGPNKVCAWRRNAGRNGEAVVAPDSSVICLTCGHSGFCLRWRESGVTIVCSAGDCLSVGCGCLYKTNSSDGLASYLFGLGAVVVRPS